MAKRRTDDFDVSASVKNNALNVLVVQRDTGRIVAALEIPGACAAAFSEAVAEAMTATESPPIESPPLEKKKTTTTKPTDKKTATRKSAKK